MRNLGAFLVIAALGLLGAAPAAYRVVPVPAITLVLFHQITDHPTVSASGVDNIQKPWIGVKQFDDVLAQMEKDGYHFVTPETAAGFFEGATPGSALPSKPLLISFDDGWESAWLEATPILRKHHIKAVMFFEGILTDIKPGRLTTSELKAMLASGTWTLQSHGWKGHSNIVTDATGTTDPYWYANLKWLADRARLETPAEYEDRIADDLMHFRNAFESKLGIHIDGFAFPSGEYGQSAAHAPPAAPLRDLYPYDVHSDAAGLTPYLIAALKRAGFRWSVAVGLYGENHAAQAMDGFWRLPRIGIGANSSPRDITAAYSQGFQLPEMTADRQYADCGPVAFAGESVWTGSTNRPEIDRLDRTGRLLQRYVLPQLLAGRGSNSSAISGLAWDGVQLIVTQNAADPPNSTPATITRLVLAADGTASIVSRVPMPGNIGYLTGIALVNGKLIAVSDDGTFFDLSNGAVLFNIDLTDTQRAGRFRGPLLVDGKVAAYDTQLNAVEVVNADRTIEVRPLPPILDPGMVEDVSVDGADILLNIWSPLRHALVRYAPITGSTK